MVDQKDCETPGMLRGKVVPAGVTLRMTDPPVSSLRDLSASRTADFDGLIRSLSLSVTHHRSYLTFTAATQDSATKERRMALVELVGYVIGVDADKDRITEAVVCSMTQGELASQVFATTTRLFLCWAC